MYATAAKIAAPVLNGQIECPKDMADLFEVATCKLGQDPTRPPDKNNIRQVIEMKFPGDAFSDGQEEDYRRIGGRSKLRLYQKSDPCECGDSKPREVPVPVPVPAPDKVRRPVLQRSGPTAGDWAILIGLGLATVGLALLPVDGPAGEAAAGAATAAQWARMFGTAAAL